MQAWLCDNPSGVAALRWADLPTPEPAARQVRVAVHAASLNFPDLLIVENKYQVKPPLPFVPGSEFSGVVEVVGTEVKHLKPGDRIATIGSTGGFATHALVDAAMAMPLPRGFDLDDAAAFAFTYGTSHHALVDRGQLAAGQTLLVLGAAGGVGSAAVQIGKALGATVIAAVSSNEKAAFCQRLGADHVVTYGGLDTSQFREAIKQLTAGRGPDVVYDPIGGDLAEPALRSIAWRGRYLVVGFAAGPIPALPWNLALLKGASIVGVFWGEFVRREPSAFQASLGQLFQWYAQGLVKPAIDRVFPLQELHAGYARMSSRQVMGKLLLKPSLTGLSGEVTT
jgi:NADPH:quinone reductase